MGWLEAGLVLWIADRGLRVVSQHCRSNPTIRNRKSALVLLAISALLTLLTYAWYNTQFVQHQGRSLFTALIPIALAFALGWEAALWLRAGRILAAVLIGFTVVLAAWGVLSHTGLPKWPMMITAVLAAGLFVASWLPRKLSRCCSRRHMPCSCCSISTRCSRRSGRSWRANTSAIVLRDWKSPVSDRPGGA